MNKSILEMFQEAIEATRRGDSFQYKDESKADAVIAYVKDKYSVDASEPAARKSGNYIRNILFDAFITDVSVNYQKYITQ